MGIEDKKSESEQVKSMETIEQPIGTVETEKNPEEFANETLAKIDKDIEALPNTGKAIETIDGSILFDNPNVLAEVKANFDINGSLKNLDSEALQIKDEAKLKINDSISEFSRKYHHPNYRSEIAKNIVEVRKTGGNAEKVRDEFHEKTVNEKENFESQEKERSVAEIMKEKDTIIVHGMPIALDSFGDGRGSDFNNRVINNKDKSLDFNSTYNIIAGLSPTISASIASSERHNNGLYMKQGIILGEGKVLSAKTIDSGSVAFGLNKRIPKYGNEDHKHSAIQPEVNIDTVMKPGRSSYEDGYNELTVESPKVAGLYTDMTVQSPGSDAPMEELKPRYGYDGSTYSDGGVKTEHWLSEERIREKAAEAREMEVVNHEKNLLKMKEFSDKMNVPLYAFKNEEGKLNKYRVDFEQHPDWTPEYFKNEILPVANKKREELGGDPDNPEFVDFHTREIKPIYLYAMKGERPYKLVPVTAEEIHNRKPEISKEEKQHMIQSIKEKGVFTGQAEKEVEKKLQE